MNENEQELLHGLRTLAADSPREAPAYVERRLLAEFHRRSRTRRRNIWWIASSTGAIAAAVAVALWIQPAPRKAGPAVAKVVTSQPSDVATAAAPIFQPAVRIQKAAARPTRATMTFYPLPDSEALPPLENATVIRVQLPMSSLRLMGFPIDEDRAGDRIEADVLLGQDGLARGVRFVR